ncbi:MULTISPECIES: hypothetical protein [unclassified Kitasatospora]|uniref:hypothetical protein n=1 Tax=unclassified Kitasatospora TaxID=2633591 RepID=UPI0033C8FB4A
MPAAADQPLKVRAETWVSYDVPVITVLEVDLGLPWPSSRDGEPIRLGDLPVDRCGMVLGDSRALDSFVGLPGESIDGLADVTYWGKYEDDAHARFGGERTPQYGGQGPYGRLDLPLHEAHEFADQLQSWLSKGPRVGLVVSVDAHTHFHLLDRAGQTHPCSPGRSRSTDARSWAWAGTRATTPCATMANEPGTRSTRSPWNSAAPPPCCAGPFPQKQKNPNRPKPDAPGQPCNGGVVA